MTEPIGDDALDRLFGPVLGGFGSVVLAVSGGADSTALMVLVARWMARRVASVGPRVLVATFDHRLRASSAEEAHRVGLQARQLGLPHEIVTWDDAKPRSGLQAAAREARYGALSALAGTWVDSVPPVAIVTAHHADDQAETLIMRLARGSGLDGLAAMPAVRWLVPGQIALVRPLLGTSKSALVATLEAAGVDWQEDPSNRDVVFERVRVRNAGPHLAALGLTGTVLAEAAERLGRAREAIDRAVKDAEAEVLAVNRGAYAALARGDFDQLPAEVRIRILARVLFAFGGQDTPPELCQVEALAGLLESARAGFTTTLGGCLVWLGPGDRIVIHRERRRSGFPVVRVEPGGSVSWDGRFRITLGAQAHGAVRVGAVCEDRARQLVQTVSGLPEAAARTLPVGWRAVGGGGDSAGLDVAFTYPRRSWGKMVN